MLINGIWQHTKWNIAVYYVGYVPDLWWFLFLYTDKLTICVHLKLHYNYEFYFKEFNSISAKKTPTRREFASSDLWLRHLLLAICLSQINIHQLVAVSFLWRDSALVKSFLVLSPNYEYSIPLQLIFANRKF